MTPPFDKASVARSFDRAAADYDAHAVLQRTVVERLVERLALVNLQPGTILDLGAGTGCGAAMLAKIYATARILQLDISPAMLAVSREKQRSLRSLLRPRHRYLAADAEHLPLADSSVDLVFSSLTLQWCNDLDTAFQETARVLRPGGLFLFATLGPDTLKELRLSWQAADDAIHINRFYDMHDVGDALVRAGMESVVMDVETITLTYDKARHIMQDLKTLGAQNSNRERRRGLTGKRQLAAVIAAYESYRHNGKLPATYEVVYGHGWRGVAKQQQSASGTTYVPVDSLRRQRRK